MSVHIKDHRAGFGLGETVITRIGEAEDDTGIHFSILKMKKGETRTVTPEGETAWLLMNGTLKAEVAGKTATFTRSSLFDESASCVHVAAGEKVVLTAETDVELSISATANKVKFAPRFFTPAQVPNEHRGKGTLGDTCYRYVRTIFDGKNSDPACELVLGEVVTHPGRWSSYPPHHHPQPEIYHYRFTLPQGYGHGESGEQVFMIRDNDTLKIFDGNDHPQCAAPGYGMYYIWVIRHLPGNPYTVPEFTAEHRWAMDPKATYWTPAAE
jgi:5-deoxy-glucuronate isomerase